MFEVSDFPMLLCFLFASRILSFVFFLIDDCDMNLKLVYLKSIYNLTKLIFSQIILWIESSELTVNGLMTY